MKNESQERKLLRKLVSGTTRSAASSQHADFCISFQDWQWQQGVALYGLMKAHAALGDETGLNFVREWVDQKLAASDRPKSINTTAPVLAIAELNDFSPQSAYREVCDEYAEWCLKQAPRLSDGTYEHSCTENKYPLQVWADTLFMGCIFLLKWGLKTGNSRYVQEAVTQFEKHYHYLQDTGTGLIYHGYDGATKSQMGVLWGRGNGWFTVASVEVLQMLSTGSPKHALLLKYFRRHLEGVIATQNPSGAWHTVMNDQSTYLEMSGTAAFALGLRWAGNQPWGDARHRVAADLAYAAQAEKISSDGELRGASGGTPVMPAAADYNAIPFAITGFSQGLAMLAFSLECEAGINHEKTHIEKRPLHHDHDDFIGLVRASR